MCLITKTWDSFQNQVQITIVTLAQLLKTMKKQFQLHYSLLKLLPIQTQG